MEKYQKFPKTVGTAVNVTDPTGTTAGDDAAGLNTVLSLINSKTLTQPMIDYLTAQIDAEAYKEALKYLTQATEISEPSAYYADRTLKSNISATVTVTLQFRGNNVDAVSIPSGWSKVSDSTGVYTYSLDKDTMTAPATSFTVNVDDSDNSGYKGDLKISSTAKSITYQYPIYFGWSTTEKCPTTESGVQTLVNELASQYHEYGTVTKTDMTNTTSNAAFLWIVTKGSANLQQMAGIPSLIGSTGKVDGGNIGVATKFKSTIEGYTSIELEAGFKIYRLNSDVAAGNKISFTTFQIN